MTTAARISCTFVVLFATAAPSIAPAQDQRAFLTLILNDVDKGEVLVQIGDSDVWIGVDVLEEAGLSGFAGGRRTVNGAEYVSLASLSPDVRFEFDERTLTLRVTADPALLASVRRTVQAAAPPELQHVRNASGFVNYALNWRGQRQTDLFSEAGISVGGALLSSTMSVVQGARPVRGLTSLSIDQRPGMRRWVAGDILATGGPVGGDAFLGGLSVGREFSIEPYFHRYPGLSVAGAVTTPSTAEVYVNQRLVQTQQLAPGQFELTDLPLASGINDARLIIKDAFGNVREVSESYYLTTTTLAPGLNDYRYSAGFQRRSLSGNSWAYGRPMVMAHHRRGLTSYLTAGGRAEWSRQVASGGPIVNLRLPFGELEAIVGVSQAGRDRGVAGSLSFTHVGRRASVGLAVQPASSRYATISTLRGFARPRLDISAFASAHLWGRTSLTLQHSQASMYTGEVRQRTSLLASTTLARRLLLIASGASGVQDGRRVRNVFAGLTFSFGIGGTATAGAEQIAGQTRGFAEVHRPLPVGTGYGYRLRAEDGDRRLWTGLLEYQNRFGRYEVRRERLDRADHTTVSVSGGLVAIGGGLYPSRPVQSSFALVRVPEVKGVRAYANRQEVGRTNGNGDLLIPDLLSYYGNLVNISDEDVPLGYDISRVQMTIAPPHRGGALVVFPVKRIQTIVGTVRVEANGTVTVPAYGALTVSAGDATFESPVGSNGEFYFENIATGRHRAVLEYKGQSCTFDLEIPPLDEPVNQLGTVTCVVSGGAR